MKKILVMAVIGLMLTSCSHNGFFVGQGRVLCLNGSGLTYVNGIFASDMSRENTETEVEVQDSDGIGNATGTSQMEGGFKIKRRIGKQCSGYLVELAEASPEVAKEYVAAECLPDGEQMHSLPSYKGQGTAGEVPVKQEEEKTDPPVDEEECPTCGE